MNRMRQLVALTAIVLLAATATAHADHSSESLPEATHKPGSVMFGLERAMESVDLALTFSQEKKVRKKLKYAEERLIEANQLAEENESKRAEKAVRMYSRQMKEVNRSLERLPEDRQDDLRQHVKGSVEVQAAVLESVMKKTPEAANKGLKNVLENSPLDPVHDRGRKEDTGKSGDTGTESQSSSGYSVTGRAVPMDER